MASNPVASTTASNSCTTPPAINPFGVIALDRRSADVDQFDVVTVERGVVTGVDTEPLAADHGRRGQQVGGLGVGDDIADLAAHEVGHDGVGVAIEEDVVEGADERQTTVSPAGLQLARTRLLVDRQRRHVVAWQA